MFSFFGMFTDPASGLAQGLHLLWPGCDITEAHPSYPGLGLRFPRRFYEPANEDLPKVVSDEVLHLSGAYPSTWFVLLRTECYGGPCFDWG